MKTFKIQGLSGEKRLRGTIAIHGAKNDVLKVMAASVLFADDLRIVNVPDTEDVLRMSELLTDLGATVTRGNGELTINTSGIKKTDLAGDIAQRMRSSIVLTGPLLGRFGHTLFPAPGGCVIGTRPCDLFMAAYEKLGATVKEDNEVFDIAAKKLVGAEIVFPFQTVGGTETIMMAAVLAKGVTKLVNVAVEPEIQNLANFLVACGADIKGIGTTTLTITGGAMLMANGKAYETIPDRIETGSFLALGVLLGDDITITNTNTNHLLVPLNILKDAGANISWTDTEIKIKKTEHLKSFNIRTHEYPGFPTDIQPQFAVLQIAAKGEAVIFETIFEGRFKYTEDLLLMGADIVPMNPREVLIRGPKELHAPADPIPARDIRAGFAIVMAALFAKGETTVQNAYYIDRGYTALEKTLQSLGATITRE